MTPHFPTLSELPNINHTRCFHLFDDLEKQFCASFQDFKTTSINIIMFSNPRVTNPSDVSPTMQMEIIKLKTDPQLTEQFRDDTPILDSYKSLLSLKYPNLRKHGYKYASLFGSTYICK